MKNLNSVTRPKQILELIWNHPIVLSFKIERVVHFCIMKKCYDYEHYFKTFWLSGAVKPGEEGCDSLTQALILMTTVFLQQPLELPRSAYYLCVFFFYICGCLVHSTNI